MDTKALDQYLDESLKMFDDGQTFLDIRKYLESKDLSAEAIKYIIRLVDEFAIEEAKLAHQRNNAKLRMLLGVLVTLVGLLVVGGFYGRNMLIGYYRIFAFSPLAVGIFLLYTGWREYRKLKNTSPEIEDTKLKLTRLLKK